MRMYDQSWQLARLSIHGEPAPIMFAQAGTRGDLERGSDSGGRIYAACIFAMSGVVYGSLFVGAA